MRFSFLLILLFTFSFLSRGQENVWKKEVSRVIDTRVKGSRHYKGDSSLGQVIVNAVKTFRIPAFSVQDLDLKAKVSLYGIPFLFDNCIAPGEERSKQNYERFFRDSLYQFRVFEEWTFDKASNINAVIKYIAPIRNVYDEYGRYRGKQALFLIRYDDFLRITKRQSKLRMQLNRTLWKGYFESPSQRSLSTSFDQKTVKWIASATSRIPIQYKKDTTTGFFRNEHIDSSLIQLIENRVSNARMIAWTNRPVPFSLQLTVAAFHKLVYPSADTLVTIDPVTNNEIVQWMQRGVLWRSSHYIVLQDWVFDQSTGTTKITLTGLAPCDAAYGNEVPIDEPIFWVQYENIIPLINQVDQYYPERSFTMLVWSNFFFSDKKPQLQSR